MPYLNPASALRTALLAAAATLPLASLPARAQEAGDGAGVRVNPVPPSGAEATPAPTPDKSGYTLFNPTPEAAMRAFAPDRPEKGTNPFTVDAGHFQYETDLFNYTYSRNNGTTTRQYQLADPTLKLGLTANIDFEIAFGGYQHLQTTGRGGGAGTFDGAGDTQLRLKWNLWGNDGGTTALAVIPYVKIPTSAYGLGNNQVEGGLIATLALNLPYDFTAIVQTEVDVLKNGANSGKHGNFVNLANISHSIYGDLAGTVELFSSVPNDRATPAIYTLDLALTYLLGPNVQLDSAAYVGLTRLSPALTLYAGISQRF